MAVNAAAAPAFSLLGTYTTGLASGDGELTAGETAAVWQNRLFVTNASDVSLDIVDIGAPSAPVLLERVDLGAYGAEVTSVDVSADGIVAVALKAADKVKRGKVVLLDADGEVNNIVRVGALPDMVTFTPDGRYVLVANEGEPNCYGPGCQDPAGTISLIDATSRKRHAIAEKINFLPAASPAMLPAGVRIFGPGSAAYKDLEPEYITVSDDSRTAWVTLQENNAIAEIDIDARRVERIWPLGYKDHGLEGNGLDASDKDEAINIVERPRVYGMYQPDAVAQLSMGNAVYLLTANEGDAREYEHPSDPAFDFAEEERAADLAGEPGLADIDGISDDSELGRLTVTTYPPAGDAMNLYAFGSRSFSVWNAATGEQLWDSGDALETITADVLPDDFNSNNSANDTFDNRSDNKGPEPEGIAIGTIGEVPYAFVGLERIGGVMVYELSDPAAPVFVDYLQTRVFDPNLAAGPDSGPEVLRFVPATADRDAMLVVANEITGTVNLWSITDDGAP